MGNTIGFDAGSGYTKIYVRGDEKLRLVPSVVTVEKKTGRVAASGNDAMAMIGRAPASLNVIKPIRNALVNDIGGLSLLLGDILDRLFDGSAFKKTDLLVSIPYGAKKDERAMEDAIMDAGIATFDYAYAPIAIALGAGMPVDIPTGRMVVDVGAGHCEAAIISHGGVVSSGMITTAGDAMTEAVREYVVSAYGVDIGELTAEEIKRRLGTLDKGAPKKSIKISGKARGDINPSVAGKITASAVISSWELVEVLTPFADKIVENIVNVLGKTPPEISSDVADFGILLSGGAAALGGVKEYIQTKLGIKVACTKAPAYDSVRGLKRIIEGGRAFAKFTK